MSRAALAREAAPGAKAAASTLRPATRGDAHDHETERGADRGPGQSRTPWSFGKVGVTAPDAGGASGALGEGRPLEGSARSEMEQRFGRDFGDVRIHTDDRASMAADGLNAAAFTLGHNIAFAKGRYAPHSPRGRLLLLHELRHVEQQRSAAPVATPEIDPPNSRHEGLAQRLIDPNVGSLSVQRIQCASSDDQYSLGGGMVDSVGKAAFGPGSWPFIKAVLEGFVGGLKGDVKSGRADEAKEHLSKLLVPWNAAKFYGGYLVGLVVGLVSPITDLVKGVIGLVKLGVSALEWLAKWSPVGIAISPQRQKKIMRLMDAFADLTSEFGKSLVGFASDPKGAISKLAGFLDNLQQMALGKAREIGGKAAHSIFDFLRKDFYEMGRGVGEVIGTLVAQVLMLVFSEAIGNLITKGASFLGKAAEFVAGKAVAVFQWIKSFASETVSLLRNAVKGALRLFEGLVSKAIEAFDALAALLMESEALEAAGEKVAAGVGREVGGPTANFAESRMVVAERTTKTTKAQLATPKIHPSNVAKEVPKAPEVGKAPIEEPLTKGDRGLTRDQLRQKHSLEEQAERQRAARPVTKKEVSDGPFMDERNKAGAGMAEKPKHHVFPQEFRTWFEDRGFTGDRNIDNFTVKLDQSAHEAIHGGGDYRIGRTTGFGWNDRVMAELVDEESKLGRRMRYEDIVPIVQRLMRKYKIPRRYTPY